MCTTWLRPWQAWHAMAMRDTLEKWRELIEPVLAQSATPLSWPEVQSVQNVQVYEGLRSVIVTRPGSARGRPAVVVWVAAGDLAELAKLLVRVEESAMTAGIDQVVYLGRRGWIRALGFEEIAVVAVKEL